MQQRRWFARLTVLSVAFACAALFAAGTGCGTVEAKPVDVTYFYLPG